MSRSKPAQEERPPILSADPLSACIEATAALHPPGSDAHCVEAARLYCAHLGIPSDAGAPPIPEA
jgi:hypothetical protein